MKIQVVGDIKKPVIVMLSGSFCPSACLGYIYEKMQDDYCIVLPEYGGHYENSTFTTRANEASQITDYLVTHNMINIRMIYGQSMGSEVGIVDAKGNNFKLTSVSIHCVITIYVIQYTHCVNVERQYYGKTNRMPD